MGREIKFRVWMSGYFIYLPFWRVSRNGDNGIVFQEQDCTYFDDSLDKLDSVFLQQYTGIKDRNDKEIYEGDIISCLGTDLKEESRHEVKYGSGGFYLDKKDYLWYGVKHGIYEDGEIIGNVYENPELIKSEL